MSIIKSFKNLFILLALTLLSISTTIISCGGDDDELDNTDNNETENGNNETDDNSTKFGVTFSQIEHKNGAIHMTVKVNNPKNLTKLKGGFECSFIKDFSDQAYSEKDLNSKNSTDLQLTVSHSKVQYFRPYVKGPSIGTVYGKTWTYNGMSGEITPPNNSITNPDENGEDVKPPTTPIPNNVSYFNVTTKLIKQLLNSTYMGNNQWRLLTRTFSEVTYNWECDDSSVIGIVVVLNNPKTPIDGIKYAGPNAEFFNRSGINIIKQWPQTGGYYNFYVRTFTLGYHYSSDWITKQVYIEGSSDRFTTSSTPGI